MNKKKDGNAILITGGAGFIGSHMVDHWVRQGAKVIVVDNLSTGKKEWLTSGVAFYKLDLNKSDQLSKILSLHQPKIIHHFSGHTRLREALKDPKQDAQDNLGTTLSLIQACIQLKEKFGYQPQRIVFSSTAAVFGGNPKPPFNEQSPLFPISPYGIAKQAAEKYLEWYANQSGVKVCSLRYANVYGPRQSVFGEAGVVAKFMDALVTGQPLCVYGDGSHQRDYIYVDDVVAANAAVVQHGCTGTYVVGTGKPTTTLELANACLSLVQTKPKVIFSEQLLPEQEKSWLKSTLLTKQTGWRPQVSLKDGLNKTFQWYRDHAG